MSSLIYCKSVYILLPNDVINVGILYKVHDVKQNLTAIVMGQEITMLESIIQNPMQNYNRKGHYYKTGLCSRPFVPTAFVPGIIGGFCPESNG